MRPVLALGIALGAACLAGSTPAVAPTPWSSVPGPSPGPALAIGFYSSGCVQGARELPLASSTYTVMRPERRRNFGHPLLVDFVTTLASQMAKRELAPLGVGDLGQARGGPAPNGHASHQNGLDADLWFMPGVPGAEQRSMVDTTTQGASSAWSDRVPRMLELAASDARVDRIFVNPIVKKLLCEQAAAPGPRPWLAKIRPWWGHDEHFHVRLACPADSPSCRPQPPLAKADGCAELDWWLSAENEKDRKRGVATYGKRVGAKPKLPDSCEKLLP